VRLTRPIRCVFFGDLYPNKECYDARTASGLRTLLKIRRNIASGTVTDYWADANYIGWVRRGQGHKICVTIVSNADSYVPFSQHPLQAFERTEAKTNWEILSLHYLRISSNEPHTMRMFVGKVSRCGTRGHEHIRLICSCYLPFTVPVYAHTPIIFFRVTTKPSSVTSLPRSYRESRSPRTDGETSRVPEEELQSGRSLRTLRPVYNLLYDQRRI